MIKIFEKDGKINFVDELNTLVGFDYQQSCCENFGWYLLKSEPKSLQIDESEKIDHEKIDLSNYLFDKGYFKIDNDEGYDNNNFVVFRIKNEKIKLYLILYNSHNGYYGHGFNMDIGGKTIYSDIL